MVTPRIMTGFMELLPEDQILFERMKDTIRGVYEAFGFLPLDTATIEISEVLLAKAGGETEKQIYRFQKGDHDLALRFDLTVPLARYVAQHENELVFPFKRYQMSKVFRGERPQKGRFREFYQCDIDVIGIDSIPLYYDAEMPSVIYHVFKKLDFGPFTIRLNNRKVLNGFFSELGLSDKIADVLRTIDKLDKIGEENVVKEVAGFEIPEEKIARIMDLIHIKGTTDEILDKVEKLPVENAMFREGADELKEVVRMMRLLGMPDENFEVDLTIARGLDYYTGTVYETRLDDYPQLGSVCSGGRYDNLTGYYTKTNMPGIGISIGLTRLFAQLKEAGIVRSEEKTLVQSLVIPMGEAQLSAAVSTAAALREAGIRTDVYSLNKGMKQKMKYAARVGVKYIVLIGEEEAAQGKVALKNMQTGEQITLSIEEAIQTVQEK